MESQAKFSSLLAHLHIENLPLLDAPGFHYRSAPVSEEFKLFHANFRESLKKLRKSNESGYQTIILGGILNRLELSPEILFCGGNMYPPFVQEYIHTIEAPLQADPSLLKFINTQLSSCTWFHDFVLYYTDPSLNLNISVINFEVKIDPIDSVFDHPDFFKVFIGQLSHYAYLKKNSKMHCEGFCTSSVLFAGTDVWILHFVIQKDQENPDVLRRLLYISDKYDLTLEEDAMVVQTSLKWAVERGLSNSSVLKQSKSSDAMETSIERLTTSFDSVKVSKVQRFTVRTYSYHLNNVGGIIKEEAIQKFEQLYPDTDFEERILTEIEYEELFDQTRLVYFASKDQIVLFENNVPNNSKFFMFEKYRVLIPKEKSSKWKYIMQREGWDAITANNSGRAFEAPLSITESLREDSLFIKLEDDSNPIILEKLTSIRHPNVMNVIKVIQVENKFVATINETLYPLSSIFDRNNQHHRVGKCEIENLLFCFEIIQDIWNGLKYLTTRKIYYKDLSPNNIMLSKDLTKAKLIDFESCCDDIEKWKVLSVYTSVYTPNESYDEQSQIFSLGVLLCELIFMVLAQYSDKKNQPKSIEFDSKYIVTKICEIPPIHDLRQFILQKFLRYFPQHLYYIQFFVDTCIVEKTKRFSAKMFDLALSTWIKILNYEQKIKKNSYSILPQIEKHFK